MEKEEPVATVEEIRAARPREVVVARTLAIVAAVLWIPVLGYLYPQVGILLVLYVFGAFGAAKGRQAGRVMATLALAILLLALVPYCRQGFTDQYPSGSAYAVMDIVAVLLAVTGLVLQYLPPSGRYVHLVSVALRQR